MAETGQPARPAFALLARLPLRSQNRPRKEALMTPADCGYPAWGSRRFWFRCGEPCDHLGLGKKGQWFIDASVADIGGATAPGWVDTVTRPGWVATVTRHEG